MRTKLPELLACTILIGLALLLGLTTTVFAQPSSCNVLGYWSFDAGDATDDSGSGHHGVIAGSPDVVTGMCGNALQFNVPNTESDWVVVDYPAFDSPTVISMTGWVNVNQFTQFGSLVGTGSLSNSRNPYWIGIHNSPEEFVIFEPFAFTGASPSLGTWAHFALVQDFTTGRRTVYINGVQIYQDFNSLQPAPDLGAPLLIAADTNGAIGDFFFLSGIIDEVKVFGCALDDAQVQQDFETCGLSGSTDTDGDTIPDDEDNCPDDANTDQADLDEDGLGDVCDDDADGDGELPPLDCNDLDPAIFTTAIEICTDEIDNDCDLLVDAADDGADCDGDGIPNGLDNCPDNANTGQIDLDMDGLGNVCDPDDDDDGYDDDMDNCPVVANDQADLDGDGVGDACDDDADGDSVADVDDLCLSTAASDTDAGVPSRGLGKNRWADADGDGLFDTSGKNPTGRNFTINDTAGCNCAQIIEQCGYGKGHTKFGCSNSTMDWWTGRYDRDGEAPYQCKED